MRAFGIDADRGVADVLIDVRFTESAGAAFLNGFYAAKIITAAAIECSFLITRHTDTAFRRRQRRFAIRAGNGSAAVSAYRLNIPLQNAPIFRATYNF